MASLLDGRRMRQHGEHGWCSLPREGLCVPRGLHAEFVGRLDKPSAEADLRAWYRATVASYAGVVVGDDTFDFWRNQFAAWVGTVTAAPRDGGKGDASRDAMRRVLARHAAKETG